MANKTKEMNDELGALSLAVPKFLAPSSFQKAEHLCFGQQRHQGLQTADAILKISPIQTNQKVISPLVSPEGLSDVPRTAGYTTNAIF